jgi:hypothetical protein
MAAPPRPGSPGELVRVVDAFFRASTAAERKPLEAALVAAQGNPSTLLPALAVLASPPGGVSNEALLFCLSAAEAQLSATVVWADDLLRSAVAALGALTAAPVVGRKASSVLALLARRYAAQLWPSHCAAIVGLISAAGPPWGDKARGLALLLDTCEAFSGVAADGGGGGASGGGTGARRQSPRQVKASRALLIERLPSFVELLLQQLTARGALPGEHLAQFDASVTLPALAVCEQLAAWAPLGAHVSPPLLTQLLSVAGQAFVVPTASDGIRGASSTSSPTARAGLAALGVLTELMARSLVPPSYRDFLLALASQTVAILDTVLAPCSAPSGGAPPIMLTGLPEEPVSRLTAYLAAFTANVLPRVHAHPSLPLRRVLELLFTYTLSQPTGDGFVGALPMWASLAAAAGNNAGEQQPSSGGSVASGGDGAPVAAVYDTAFRALSGQLVDKLLRCRRTAAALSQQNPDADSWDDEGDESGDDASDSGLEGATGAGIGGDDDSDPMGDEISQAAADAVGTFLASAPGDGGGDDGGNDDGGVLDDDALLRGGSNGVGSSDGGPLAGVYTRDQLASNRGRYLTACRRLLLQLCGASQGAASDTVGALLGVFAQQSAGAVAVALQPTPASAVSSPAVVEDAVTLHLLLADILLQLPHGAAADVARAVTDARAQALQPHLRALVADLLHRSSEGAVFDAMPPPHALRLLCAHVCLGKALHAVAVGAAVEAGAGAGGVGGGAAAAAPPPQPLVDAVGETLALLQAASGAVNLPSTGGGGGGGGIGSGRAGGRHVRLLHGQLLDALTALTTTRPGAAAVAALAPPYWDAAVVARVLDRLSPPYVAQLLVAVFRGLASPVLRPGVRGPEAAAAAAAATASLQRYFAPLTAPISAAWAASPLQAPPTEAAAQPAVAACGVLARVAAALAGEPPSALSLLLSGVAAPVIPSLSSAVMATAASFVPGGTGSVFCTPEVTALAAASVTAFTTVVAACRPVIADGEMAPLVTTLAAAVAALPSALTGHDALSLPPDWTDRVRTARGLVRLLRRLVRPGAGGARRLPGAAAPAAAAPSPGDAIRDAALACALGPLAALVAPALSADAAAAAAASANPIAAALTGVAAQELLPPVHALCRDVLRYHWRYFVATGPPDADGRRSRRLMGAPQAAAFSRLTALLTDGVGHATLSPQLFRLHLTSLALLHKEHALLALPAFTGGGSGGSSGGAAAACDDPLAQAPAGPGLVVTLLSLLASGDRAALDDDLRGLLWACVAHDGGAARFVAPGGPLEVWAAGALASCPPGSACAVSSAGMLPLPQGQWPVAGDVYGVLAELRQRAAAPGGSGSGLSSSSFDEAVRSLQAAFLPLAVLRQRAGAR